MSEQTGDQVEDRIEKDIHVAAHVEEVWELVSRPGWWINDGDIDDQPQLSSTDDLTTLTHPEWGAFTLRTEESERPSRIVFRWTPAPSDHVDDEVSTLVTFTLATEPGGTRLRVEETGFSALTDDPETWQAQLEDNAQGWQNELRAARDFVTAHRG